MNKFIKQGKQLVAVNTDCKKKLDRINSRSDSYWENLKDVNYLTDNYELVLRYKVKK